MTRLNWQKIVIAAIAMLFAWYVISMVALDAPAFASQEATLTITGRYAAPERSIPASAPARTIVISVVSTTDGPQIYQSGSIKGWTVEESLFLDSSSGAEAMGPLLLGKPAAPESSVTLTTPLTGPPSVKEWIAKDAAWQPEMVLFRSAHRQGGAGMFLDLVAPWPKGTTRLHHLFTY